MSKAVLPPSLLLQAYASGLFPMADSKEDASVYWVEPKNRGILPLESFHISKSLKRFMKKAPFEIKFNTAFRTVMGACADRKETWINALILDSYDLLHESGYAHSVECWQEERLVGGLYGVSLQSAFFGESMFSKTTNASKVALCALVNHLKKQGFTLLDTQFITSHLKTFGAIEIPQKEYLALLSKALKKEACF